jgi:NADPH:quinone reductase-like Zn-dependent oxidoreductase
MARPDTEASVRAIQIPRAGGPEVLQVVDLPEPKPEPGQVVVATTMIGVNFTDLFQRMLAGDSPVVPGVEAVGIVVATGEGVADVRTGQRVIAAPLYALGAYADQVVVDATHVLPVPDSVSDEAAATLTLNYGTAYAALHYSAQVRTGETVVIHAAAGGVGTAAVQLARLVNGTHVIGTASEAKHDYLRAQGVHEAIDYQAADWVAEIRKTQPDGVDVILDGVGEDGFARSISLLRFGGRVVGYGLSAVVSGSDSAPDVEGAMSAPSSLGPFISGASGFIGFHLGAPASLFRQWMTHLIGLCDSGRIRPHIDKVFALEEAADAHRYLHDRRNVGKVLLRP